MKYAIILQSPDKETSAIIGFTNTPIISKNSTKYYNKFTVELKENVKCHIELSTLNKAIIL